ncbi:hypothetical protein Q5752_005679 [Cryptotrichosporon argae]
MADRLSSERLADERAFVKRYTESLAGLPVNYPADYSTPLEDRPRKVAVVQVAVAEPPDVMDIDTPQQQEEPISLTVKSLKPALTIPLTVRPSDSVAALKALVAATPAGPPAAAQRLVLKGKALADDRLLVEYGLSSGSTVHLMFKPEPTPAPAPVPPAAAPAGLAIPGSDGVIRGALSGIRADDDADAVSAAPSAGAPQLTIQTELPDRSVSTPQPLTITEQTAPPLGPQGQITSQSFHDALADTAFWQRLHALCLDNFSTADDADSAWETFLTAAKAKLSAGEAAKIRDVVGVRGMGGGSG